MISVTNLAKCRAEAGGICCQCGGLIRFMERQASTDHRKSWMHLHCLTKLRDGEWADAYPPPPDEVARAQRAEAGLAWLRSAGRQVS